MSAIAISAKRPADASPTTAGRAAFAITCLRVPIGISILLGIIYERPLAGSLALTLFVVLDIGDGKIGRSTNSDTAYRRGLDSIIDRATVLAFFLAASFYVHDFRGPVIAIVVANLTALPFAASTWRKSRLVLKAPSWHHSWSITLFIGGVLYFVGYTRLAVAAAAAASFDVDLHQLPSLGTRAHWTTKLTSRICSMVLPVGAKRKSALSIGFGLPTLFGKWMRSP